MCGKLRESERDLLSDVSLHMRTSLLSDEALLMHMCKLTSQRSDEPVSCRLRMLAMNRYRISLYFMTNYNIPDIIRSLSLYIIHHYISHDVS